MKTINEIAEEIKEMTFTELDEACAIEIRKMNPFYDRGEKYWRNEYSAVSYYDWNPSTDRNKSEFIRNKVIEKVKDPYYLAMALIWLIVDPFEPFETSLDNPPDYGDCRHWETASVIMTATAKQETQASLIANRIYNLKNDL